MNTSSKSAELSKRQNYELEEIHSVQKDHVSATYETLDNMYPGSMKESSSQSMVAGCETSDGHEAHLLQANKTSGRKLLFILILIAIIVVLFIASAVFVAILLSTSNQEVKKGKCDPNIGVPNGKIVNFTGSNHGDTFQVECNSSSKLIGNAMVTCYSSNQWSRLPRCVLKQCDPYVTPDHGKIGFRNKSTIIGATISIICNNGFARTGPGTVVCQNNETWSETPICAPVDCGSPNNIANGKIYSMTGTIYKSTFSVACLKGYQLTGESNVTCNINSKWSAMPVCKPVSCGVPGIPKNGHIKYINGTMFGSVAIIGCDEIFFIRGDPTLNCTADGKWMPHSYCETNAEDNGASNNTWKGQIQPYTKPVHCGVPNIPSDGSLVSLNGTTFQSLALIRCDVGFMITGNANIRCLRNGSWSEAPKCLPVSCGLPDKPLNGTVGNISGTTYGETVEIKCNNGFILSGSHAITCLSNGKWAQGASCLPTATDCYDIQKSSNKTPSGIYNITLWSSRKTIQVYCDMDTDGGGWTVFQYRYNGTVDFYNSYKKYEDGFGNLNSEFWLGLKYIQEISTQGRTELRIDLHATDDSKVYRKNLVFFLSPKKDGYMLNIGGAYPLSLDYYFSKSNGMKFSTYDYSPYGNPGTTCAVNYRGAWWHTVNPCTGYVNLNGYYRTPGRKNRDFGMLYSPYIGYRLLKSSKMMMKRF